LDYGEKIERRYVHLTEQPIALNSAILSNSQRTKPPYAQPADFFIFEPKGKELPTELCDTFMALLREEIIPSWSIEFVPVDKLKEGAKGRSISTPRAWMCKGLILFLPRTTEGNLLQIEMVIAESDHPVGKTQLWDVDSGESFSVIVPPEIEGVNFSVKWLKLF
jgi:hypothetical protein